MKQGLVDSHKRVINYLRVSITDRCNLRCTYCMPASGMKYLDQKKVLTFEEILRIIRVLAQRGLKKVRVTGGEPTVRPGLTEFIADLNKVEGITDIAMTSNGIYLKKLAQPLFQAGLRRINLSLDTLDRKKFAEITRRDYYDKVWEGINEAERVGMSPIKINIVAQRGFNDSEMEDFVKLTYTKPYHIRFIEYMPVAQYGSEWKKKFISMDEMKKMMEKRFGEFIPMIGSSQLGPATNFKIKGGKGVVGFITAVSKHFCSSCNRIRLTSDGKMKQCLFSKKYIDFRETLRNGCSDEDISCLLDQAMITKPEGHTISLDKTEKFMDSMVGIGG